MSSDEREPAKTICPYCGVGCGIQVNPGAAVPLPNVATKPILENDWVDEEFIPERTEGFEDPQEAPEDSDRQAAASIEVDVEASESDAAADD